VTAEAATAQAERTYRLVVGGEPVPGSGGSYEVVDPARETVVGLAPQGTAADAADAATAAAGAFPAWSRTAPSERARLLERAADLLEQHAAELVPLVQAETGATLRMTKVVQIGGTVARLRRYARGAGEAQEIPLGPVPNLGGGPDGRRGGLIAATAVRRPVGVVACITSYNVPLNNVAGKIGPALAMGNTVVVKPAPQDPLGVIRLVEILQEAGFPPGVVNVVVGTGPETGEALVAHPLVDMVSFTGSSAVGSRIAADAGASMKRLLLELGGKGASIVFAGADLEPAVLGTASTYTFHAGQICTAPTRLYVERPVYDEVVGRLASLARALPVGDPTDKATVVGPLVTGAQRDRVEGYVRDATTGGATALAGGERPNLETGYYVAPTLLAGCPPSSPAVQEEIFGPVVVALPFDDEEEAVASANSTSYGLYDYVWTGDAAQGLRVAASLRSGNVGINTVARHPETPFGGFKQSGVGRDGGSFGLHAYGELQSIVWPG
jgi:acyl-CoA reductase-like NAD-dependent aldehyde dehydrogenase